MKHRTTLRDIAEKAGVHFTTVSRALKNHPALTEETRRQVQALAKSMGYTPDPMLSALNAYRTHQQRVVYHGTIGWLHSYHEKNVMQNISVHRRLFEGASKRAEELGYKLESIWLGGAIKPEMRLISKMLVARNIRNLIIAPQFDARSNLDLDWGSFSAIAITHSLMAPRLHTVTHDQFEDMTTIMRQLMSRGYRRIGFLIEQRLITNVGYRWLSGYLTARERVAPADRLEFLFLDKTVPAKILQDWYRGNRPDAIISDGKFWNAIAEPALRSVAPKDLGVVLVSVGLEGPFAGIIQNSERVGACAVDQLVRMGQSDERGVPSHPQRIFIEGDWKDGTSLPSRSLARVLKKKNRR